MKQVKIQLLDNTVKEFEVGKRFGELYDIVSDILIDGSEVIVVYGALFEVFSGMKYEYREMHATKNPYQFKGREKNI